MHSKKCSAHFEAESFIPDMCTIGALSPTLEEKVEQLKNQA